MPKYCPKCQCEFVSDASACPKDKVSLVKDKPTGAVKLFVDIFKTTNEIEAQRIVIFLEENKVQAKSQRITLSQFPMVALDDFVIMVEKDSVEQAKRLIQTAQEEELITNLGSFVQL